MTKFKIKKGDQVVVTAGRDKGKAGVVTKVLIEEGRVVVSGVNSVVKNMRPTQANPQGGRVMKNLPIHISNVMLADENGKPARVGYRMEDGDKVRFFKTTQSVVPASNVK